MDCSSKNPDWCSIPFGIWLCIECAGQHRKLGTHITFVRSSILDKKWTQEQLLYMKLGGNGKARAFFDKHNLSSVKQPEKKYNSMQAMQYKRHLQQLVEKE